MKIRPDQIEGVQPEQTQRKTPAASGQAFGDLLSQEVAKGTTAAAAPAPPPLMVNPLLATGTLDAAQQVDGDAVADRVESILDRWDSYAATLQSPGASLKEANGALDEIAAEVTALKAESPGLGSSHPGLQTIVDELDALAAAERFKFNRGDYI